MKREAIFLSDLKRSWNLDGFFFKIPDMPHFAGAKFRFDIAKPFDAIAALGGVAIAIEAKAFPEFKTFSKDMLRECQKEGLDRWTAAGQLALVVVQVQPLRQLPAIAVLNWVTWRERLLAGLPKAEVLGLEWFEAKKRELPATDGAKKKRQLVYPMQPFRARVDFQIASRAFHLTEVLVAPGSSSSTLVNLPGNESRVR